VPVRADEGNVRALFITPSKESGTMEEKKKVLKNAIIISIGAVAAILTLLLLYGLATGRVQETIVKYEALNYMENKYKEKFEMKKYGKYDKIFKTSWGYELWMVPKNKPDKDYTSDMEVYVRKFNKNGKISDNDTYYYLRLYNMLWNKYKNLVKETFIQKNYFSVDIRNLEKYHKEIKEITISDIKNKNYFDVEICFGIDIFENDFNEKINPEIIERIFNFINKLKEENIANYSLGIWVRNKSFDKNKKIDIKKLGTNYENIDYKIEIFNPKDLINIKEPKDIEKYIIDNRGN